MDTISWQEIAIRLLFASILGSATAIAKQWYQTKQFIQSNALMALGAAMFSILAGLTSETKLFSQLILGVSIVCFGVSLRRQSSSGNINIDPIMRLWCAGAVGSIVGFGFFVPAYIAIFITILTNLLLPTSESNFIPNLEKELNHDSNNDSNLEAELETTAEIISQETCYQCHVSCLAADEAEVLALLVHLGKEQKLRPTKISSRSLIDENTSAEIEIWVDFVSDGKTNPLQLQQVLIYLKSQLNVGSAGWLNLPPEVKSKNEDVIHKN